MTTQTSNNVKVEVNVAHAPGDVPFGVNEMRLDARQWLMAIAIFLLCVFAIPRVWKRVERFDTGTDYRIPYAYSSDYWLYQRRLEQIPSPPGPLSHAAGEVGAKTEPVNVPVVGDSVVWGEYVRADGTLSHFLNQEVGASYRFVNCGINGIFPLAMEGLIANYGGALNHRKVILHCNVLWMSSPKADLSAPEEETFNHTLLVPQFVPRIPCYRADANARLGAIAERNIGFFGWVNHLDSIYFDQLSIPRWTLEEGNGDPPRYPNSYRNPLKQITFNVPGEPATDPQRGPSSPRHKPWTANGGAPTHFEWVSLDASLQWQAFQRSVRLLQARGNDVLVVLGPFNEWMVAADQRPTFHKMRDGIVSWLTAQHIPHIVPDVLPSDLYADASHPLTNGYALLAKRLAADAEFQQWLTAK